MPFSHHSHSGQFCGHAKNTLEEVVQRAVSLGMETLALTEHMPRDERDLYPEEMETRESLFALFDAYYKEAKRLQNKYADQIHVLVGVEIDWIRSSSKEFVSNLFGEYEFDLFVGSVHHVNTIPIDYDNILYERARDTTEGTDEKIFEAYFDAQYEMLKALKPPIVGHFDLIRLKSDDFNGSFQQYAEVWRKIQRNLSFVAEYGGVLELNSAALRKGMSEPYPKEEICMEFLKSGGQFTLSDDSHAVEQVGFAFDLVLKFAQKLEIDALTVFEKGANTRDARFPGTSLRRSLIKDLPSHKFFVSTK
ncbi:MAG: histidinolphosphatase [Icmadophila ericetorum]|nr:histidinolphosphatase [Icmadophila ericetorum]